MAALTADRQIIAEEQEEIFESFVIANGAQIYVGSYVDIVAGVAQVHTTGNTPRGIAMAPGVPGNDFNMDGFANPPASAIAPGNNTAPRNRVVVNEGQFIHDQVTVITGAAGAQSDVGKLVYLSDDNLYTITQPGTDKPIGEMIDWASVGGTNYWKVKVYRYSARTLTT